MVSAQLLAIVARASGFSSTKPPAKKTRWRQPSWAAWARARTQQDWATISRSARQTSASDVDRRSARESLPKLAAVSDGGRPRSTQPVDP